MAYAGCCDECKPRTPRRARRVVRTAALGDYGLAPLALAASAGKSLVGKVTGGLFNAHPKDAGRLNSNAKWEGECSAGDQDACVALKHMSGRYGPSKQGRYCNVGGCSGWATAKTKDDAHARWLRVSSKAPTTPVPTRTSGAPLIPPGSGPLFSPAAPAAPPLVSTLPPIGQPTPTGPTVQEAIQSALSSLLPGLIAPPASAAPAPVYMPEVPPGATAPAMDTIFGMPKTLAIGAALAGGALYLASRRRGRR